MFASYMFDKVQHLDIIHLNISFQRLKKKSAISYKTNSQTFLFLEFPELLNRVNESEY